MKVNKRKENINWLEKTIKKGYGSRCRDFNRDCFCCKAWEFFDSLKNYCLPKCDFHGKCKNKAFREVYPKLSGLNKNGWSYLCKKHFYAERKRLRKMNKKFVWSGLEEIEKVRNAELKN